ncbi:MAG: hypothetical protein ABEJ89_01375 [Haloarculaceae archaeon]
MLSTLLQSFGPFGSPPGLLVALLALAAVLLVGRFLLRLAWRLVVIGIVVVALLWLLGALGFQFGVLGTQLGVLG